MATPIVLWLYLESTRAEQLGVLPGEDRLVREVMNRRFASPGLKNPSAAVKEARPPQQVVICCENDTVADALLMMEKQRMTTLPVLNEQRRHDRPAVTCRRGRLGHARDRHALLREIRNSQ